MDTCNRFRIPRPKPLAAGLAVSLALAGFVPDALAAPHAPVAHVAPAPIDAATITQLWRSRATRAIQPVPTDSIPVTNCNDAGDGSLRDAVAGANDGDTIDMTGLTCSTITLTTGAILVAQPSLTLQGPGAAALTLDANYDDEALLHDLSGTLTINDMSIKHGAKYATDAQILPLRGGCIFSGGRVSLDHSIVEYCEARSSSTTEPVLGGGIYAANGVTMISSVVALSSAHTNTYRARGGGIYTPGPLTMVYSLLVSNESVGGSTEPDAPSGGFATFGGGAFVGGALTMKYSMVTDNMTATNNGGGIFANGNAVIESSAIWGNSAGVAGGIELNSVNVTQTLVVQNSTIAFNSAQFIGGIAIQRPAKISNSTIAFNEELASTPNGAGLSGSTNIEMESVIVAHNYQRSGSDLLPDDVGGTASMTLSGGDNLIESSLIAVPPGTTSQNPRFGQFAFNGGPTPTLSLLSGSAAIDAGNNLLNADYDQRGHGFPRVIGANVDIGAYEVDTADLIFANAFEP